MSKSMRMSKRKRKSMKAALSLSPTTTLTLPYFLSIKTTILQSAPKAREGPFPHCISARVLLLLQGSVSMNHQPNCFVVPLTWIFRSLACVEYPRQNKWLSPRGRSADFQSAVSPICNRQSVQKRKRPCLGDGPQNTILRYGRLKICATGACRLALFAHSRKLSPQYKQGIGRLSSSQTKSFL